MHVLSRRACVAGLGAVAIAGRKALAASKELVVGYLYVGPRNDYGYNQSHARAAAQVATLPGVRLVEQERVPESDAAGAVMEAMIVEEGASVIYPTSYGYYDPYVLRLAAKYPDVIFRHCGGRWRKGDPLNIGSYIGHMHEGQHLAGVIAGHMADAPKLGFIASKRYPGVLRNVNSFALGAQHARKDATMQVLFTGSWSDPVREAEAVNAMADQGIKVIGCSVDSARTVVETALRRGIFACGYNASTAELGGDSYLTSVVSKWDTLNVKTVNGVIDGVRPPNFISGGLAEGIVDIDKFGPQVGGSAKQAVAVRRDELVLGQQRIWSGPLFDSAGSEVVPTGTHIERDDVRLKKMNWFVRGVLA